MTSSEAQEKPSEVVPIAEACRRLEIGESTLYRALAEEKIPGGRKLGGRWIIARSVFDRWLVDGIEPEYQTKPRPMFLRELKPGKQAS